MLRRCNATFKQGIRFAQWRFAPDAVPGDHYFHAFQNSYAPGGLDLLPYWLAGVAGDASWSEVNSAQKAAADAGRAPKAASHPEFFGPLNYAYHFDAVTLSHLLRDQAVANGVRHLTDTVLEVLLAEDGAIAGVRTEANGLRTADLYIDCTGFRAELIGKALGVPYRSCNDTLFCDSALTLQIPYERPDSPIASCTIATAREAGWIWDIGLDSRRGIGHVFSSGHMDDAEAEASLRAYIGPAAEGLEMRRFRFEAGYRETSWHKNCVAIGLSSGFLEPLESTGIIFSELAAALVANLFPWGGDFETSARQFNKNMQRRYARARDFLKLHYCITERRDTQFWQDNVDPSSISDSLLDLLDRWRFRAPNELDIDPNIDIFTESSWQYVLYGMGWETDLAARAGTLRYEEDARRAFAEVKRQGEFAVANLPGNRELVQYARAGGQFGEEGA